MLKKISRKAFLKKYPTFIQANYRTDKYIAPKSFDYYVLYVESGSTTGLCNKVSKELTALLTLLGYQKIYFLGDTTTSWLFVEHPYKPVEKALAYLVDNKISKSFNGAVEVDMKDLTEFMKHQFWLVRCNGVVMYPHFSDPGFNIMANICKYGNIHVSTLNEETDLLFNEALSKTQFHLLKGDTCGGGRIPGRRLII